MIALFFVVTRCRPFKVNRGVSTASSSDRTSLRNRLNCLRADLYGTIFFLRLSYATFLARAARVKQRSYTTRHSNVLIVATTVVGF